MALRFAGRRAYVVKRGSWKYELLKVKFFWDRAKRRCWNSQKAHLVWPCGMIGKRGILVIFRDFSCFRSKIGSFDFSIGFMGIIRTACSFPFVWAWSWRLILPEIENPDFTHAPWVFRKSVKLKFPWKCSISVSNDAREYYSILKSSWDHQLSGGWKFQSDQSTSSWSAVEISVWPAGLRLRFLSGGVQKKKIMIQFFSVT